MPPGILNSLMNNYVHCHPERSEGPALSFTWEPDSHDRPFVP